MHCRLWFYLRAFASGVPANIYARVLLVSVLLASAVIVGCHAQPGMSFEEDRPMNTNAEQDFFRQSFASQLPAVQMSPHRVLQADHTEEESYLKNIVQLLEQSKILATNAKRQMQPQRRKVFNYGAFEIDVDTIIFAIKRYLAADDYTPRGFQALPPTQLKGHYSDVE